MTAWDVASHRARWTGRQMARSDEWVHALTDVEVSELRSVATRVTESGAALDSLRRDDVPLPRLSTVIGGWADALRSGRGFVLVRGLPATDMSLDETAAAYLAIGLHLGRTVPQNAAGDLLGHVRDDGSDPDDPTVRRYRTRLPQPFHVDGADVVGLLCMHKARSGGLSTIVSSVTVYDEIVRRRPELEPLLHQPWYFDAYGQQVPGAKNWFTLPILSGSPDDFRFFYIPWYIDKAQQHPEVPRLTADQRELLGLIDRLADDPDLHLDMEFEPGDIQLLSNRTILHARTGYEDFDEPERKRHLLRLWLTLDAMP